jgi:HK97 family phage major capsid protein
MNVREILEKRADLFDQARKMLDLVDAEHREMSGVERNKYDALMADASRLKAEAEAEVAFDDRGAPKSLTAQAHWISGGPAVAPGPFLTRSQKVADTDAYKGNGEQLDPGRVIRGMVTGNWTGADNERRAMSEGVGSAGGFLLPGPAVGMLIDLARNQSVCVAAGAQTALMDNAEMVIAKVATDPTAAWVAEGSTISPTDMSFDKITLKAVPLVAMCRLSIQLATDAANIDSVIRTALSGAIGTELDRAALVGTGVNEPRGVTATPDVGSYSMGVNGAAVTNFDPWSYAVQYVQNANGQPNAAVMSPRTAGALDRLKEGTTNAPLTPPASYAGLQKFVSKQISDAMTQGSSSVASASIVGDFTQIVMGLAPSEGGQRGIRIDVSRDIGFATMELYIRAYLRCDVAVLRPAWFTKILGILA